MVRPRELKRQINSLLYERVGLSRDKEGVLALAQEGELVTTPTAMIRDPYAFEFLGLKWEELYTETQLERALLDHLQEFLLEMGKGFCFIARQQRITLDVARPSVAWICDSGQVRLKSQGGSRCNGFGKASSEG